MDSDKIKLETDYRGEGKWKKKWLIIGAIIGGFVCVIAAAISIGLWIGMKEMILKSKYELTDNLRQETDLYTDSKVVVMTTKLDNYEATFIQDYNTYIDVMKTMADGKEYCFVFALNSSRAFQPDDFNLKNKNIDKSNFTYLYYEIRGGKILDISFLTKLARNLCRNVDTYWMVEKCISITKITGKLVKRTATPTPSPKCACGCNICPKTCICHKVNVA